MPGKKVNKRVIVNEMLSKFNLYELFRILLPGSYFVYISYELLLVKVKLVPSNYDWPLTTLLGFVLSLISGTIIYSLDVCRLFKVFIKRVPTNLMTEHHPDLYPQGKENERLNEHKYYEWYENCNKKSKTKTELQSGLYHLSINFVFTSVLGLLFSLFVLKNNDLIFEKGLNLAVFCLSVISAIVVVSRRLQFQWERNYWEFEEEVIKKKKKIY
jgi:hypothetical protein